MASHTPYRILFVCLGNICRSPAAENVFRAAVQEQGLAESVRMDSAGTVGFHQDAPPDARMVEAAARRGYRFTGAARRVRSSDFHDFDLILAMDSANLSDLKEIRPSDCQAELKLYTQFCSKRAEQEVPDPYYGGSQGFEHVLDLIEDATDGLIRLVRERA
jgi:protein-tyrosine phosphatase